MFCRGLAVVLAVASTPGTSLADAAADQAAILQRFQDWTAAFNARDPDGACDLFAPDLRYAVPEIVDGTRETMCGHLAAVLARPDLRLRYDGPAVHEIIVTGDLAVVRLTWTLTTESNTGTDTTTEEGMDIFRRQPDGRWSIARFIAFDTTPDGPPQ